MIFCVSVNDLIFLSKFGSNPEKNTEFAVSIAIKLFCLGYQPSFSSERGYPGPLIE